MKKILLLLVFAVFFSRAEILEVSLSADSVLLGEICTMTVVFDESVKSLSLIDSGEWLGGTRLRDAREIFSPGEKKYQMLLSFYETPVCTIAPVSFLIESENGVDTVKTEAIAVRVPSIYEKLDSAKIDKLRKFSVITPMRAGKIPVWEIALILAALALLAVAAGVLLRKFLKKRIGRIAVVPPFEEAMDALKNLDEEDLINKGEYKTFVFSLSAILKRFVSRRYGVLIEEATSTEFKQWVRKSELTRENRILLEKFINDTDPVKFADLTPTVENLRELRVNVEEFIKITRPIENLSLTDGEQK
jgi:hypothetical protein